MQRRFNKNGVHLPKNHRPSNECNQTFCFTKHKSRRIRKDITVFLQTPRIFNLAAIRKHQNFSFDLQDQRRRLNAIGARLEAAEG